MKPTLFSMLLVSNIYMSDTLKALTEISKETIKILLAGMTTQCVKLQKNCFSGSVNRKGTQVELLLRLKLILKEEFFLPKTHSLPKLNLLQALKAWKAL